MDTKEVPFGKIDEHKIILDGWGDHPERVIGEVRDNDPEASVNYFINKFSELSSKVITLEKEIESSVNKGSFLMKLIHMKELLPSHDGLGDYQKLFDKLQGLESSLLDTIQKNRERNSEIKKSLLEEVNAAAEKINWKEATAEIHDIKTRWIKTGNALEEDQEQLEKNFWGVLEEFFEKKKRFYEDKKRLGELRKKSYQEVIKKTDALKELTGKARFDFIKKLKEEWHEIGNIPKEEYSPLISEFNEKLKSSGKPRSFNLSLDEINTELEAFLSGKKTFHYKVVENYKRILKGLRPINPIDKSKRYKAFQSIQLLLERDFVDKIALKRFNNFKELEKARKKSIRIGILEELLGRDRADLEKFQENSANFSSHSGGMMSMIEKKLKQQKGKIEVKQQLLEMLKEEK